MDRVRYRSIFGIWYLEFDALAASKGNFKQSHSTSLLLE